MVSGARPALLLALLLAGCQERGAAPFDAAARAHTEAAVRAFMATVAADVSREGPAAWQREFADGPEFFMAANGQLAFKDGAALASGLTEVIRAMPQIALRFGDDLRIVPLTAQLALIGASYREEQTDSQGHQHLDRGYFTAVARERGGRWQLTGVHWSSRP